MLSQNKIRNYLFTLMLFHTSMLLFFPWKIKQET